MILHLNVRTFVLVDVTRFLFEARSSWATSLYQSSSSSSEKPPARSTTMATLDICSYGSPSERRGTWMVTVRQRGQQRRHGGVVGQGALIGGREHHPAEGANGGEMRQQVGRFGVGQHEVFERAEVREWARLLPLLLNLLLQSRRVGRFEVEALAEAERLQAREEWTAREAEPGEEDRRVGFVHFERSQVGQR